ncbi:cobalamin biosynthesis protein CbiL [Breoghania sp.]|uniref:cobalamin biosynthesis protein CbiL n=1 Tax=Breoghania sp. TaxID=2065378 RepID=UPI002AA90280|nr:cobalamin biosynthesis protein CbiL [Breoghania sp.]
MNLRAILIALLVVAGFIAPASAHKLKVFATAQGSVISGYGFFIGGGRPAGARWVVRDETGTVLGEGKTDAQGRFRFEPAPARPLTVTIDTGEGHGASKTLSPSGTPPPAAKRPSPGDRAPQSLAKEEIAALVETAVQRQVTPLLERIEEMDARMRFTDILSGLFLIIGLVGGGLWLRTWQRS